jgi:hypothetical protein
MVEIENLKTLRCPNCRDNISFGRLERGEIGFPPTGAGQKHHHEDCHRVSRPMAGTARGWFDVSPTASTCAATWATRLSTTRCT